MAISLAEWNASKYRLSNEERRMNANEKIKYAAYWSKLMKAGFIRGMNEDRVEISIDPGMLKDSFGEAKAKEFEKALQVFMGVLKAKLGYDVASTPESVKSPGRDGWHEGSIPSFSYVLVKSATKKEAVK